MTSHLTPDAPADLPRTLGALRASGHEMLTVKDELRDNLLAKLRAGEDPFPGVVGIEDTVRPQLERALLAGHDLVHDGALQGVLHGVLRVRRRAAS